MKHSRTGRSLPADYLQPLVRALSDPAELQRIRVGELAPVAFQLALYLGVRQDRETAAVLASVYERLARDVTGEARSHLVGDLVHAVAGGATSVLALLPVLQRETDPDLVRRAGLAFALHMAAPADDPLAGPRALRALLDHAEHDAARAGIVGALLALGDQRLAPLLAGAWHALPPGAAAPLLALPRALASRLELDWLLGWLEDAEPATFAAIADSLARLPADGGGRVLELERELPARSDAGEALTVTREWTAHELTLELGERLASLERRAGTPGALASVRAAWGAA